jgi:hypothetical protein
MSADLVALKRDNAVGVAVGIAERVTFDRCLPLQLAADVRSPVCLLEEDLVRIANPHESRRQVIFANPAARHPRSVENSALSRL